jgi:uncharacterized protein YycO
MSNHDKHTIPEVLHEFLHKIKRTIVSFVNWIGHTTWPTTDVITEEERNEIRVRLQPHYYIILTRHNGYLSSYAIAFAHWVLTGFRRGGYYAHSLMNLEDDVTTDDDFMLVEATGSGVHLSKFADVFDAQCSSVALLKPKSMTIDEWTVVLDKAKTQLGKPYDSLFNLKSDRALSCVELVRISLMTLPDYHERFANFERMIKEYKNLTPQMFYECEDFEVVYEVRH